MSSPPWMPLDIDAYMSDTLHLSAAEHGAYMLLIMRYWKDGGLPQDERMIARFSRLSSDQWLESRDVLASFFDAGWKHKRIDAELSKAKDIIGKRKAAAEARHGSKPDASAEQMHSSSSYPRVPPSPLPESQEDKPLAQHTTASRGRADLEVLESHLRKAAGAESNPSPGLLVLAPILGLLDAGHDLELDVLPTIRALSRRAKRKPSTWEYFTEAIREASARRRSVAGSGLAPPTVAPSKNTNVAAAFGQLNDQLRHEREIRSRAGDGGLQSPILDLPAIRHG
jgi:uncharacterized protein YdaU (DUF1376 family)